MSFDENLLTDSFSRMIEGISGPVAARRAEQSGDASDVWVALQESGFVDALLPESAGGFGLARDVVAPLFMASAQSLLPVAFDQSVVARLIIHEGGHSAPVDAPILLWPLTSDGRLRSQFAPPAYSGGFALTQQGVHFELRRLVSSSAQDGFGVQEACIDPDSPPLFQFTLEGPDLLDWSAALSAGAIAGRSSAAFSLSQSYVMERKQFGRPLGNFQVIQHMISQAAEQMVLAMTSAHYALTGDGIIVDPSRAAMAKVVSSTAAGLIANICHAVHGAIGVSEEYDLQLYVRQLKRLSLSFGSALYWSDRVGAARLADQGAMTVDFIRDFGRQPAA